MKARYAFLLLLLVNLGYVANEPESNANQKPAEYNAYTTDDPESTVVEDTNPAPVIYDPSVNYDSELTQVDNLISQKKYRTAFDLVSGLTPQNSETLAKQVEIAISYFAQSIMHTMFAFKDLDEGETLHDVRTGGGPYNVVYADFAEMIEPILEQRPNEGLLSAVLGDYYYDAQLRYGDNWLVPSIEALEKASDLYRNAIDNGVRSPDYYSRIAEYELRKGAVSDAILDLGNALQMDPNYAEAHYNLGYALFKTGEIDSAIVHAVSAASHYVDNDYQFDGWMMAGRLSIEAGHPGDAIKYFQKAKEASPDAWEPLAYQIDAYLALDDVTGTRAVAMELFSRGPSDLDLCKMIMKSYLNADKAQEFLALSEALEEEYSDPEIVGNILYHRGYVLSTLGMNEQARQVLEDARSNFEKTDAPDHEVLAKIDQLISTLE